MKTYINSKWTSVNTINGWRHYEVSGFDKEKKQLELFAICDKSVVLFIETVEIKNRKKWIPGWKQIMES